jgi:hypothetical protein
VIGCATMSAAAERADGRLRLIVAGVMVVVVIARLRLAGRRGFRAMCWFAVRHPSIPSLLKNIPQGGI